MITVNLLPEELRPKIREGFSHAALVLGVGIPVTVAACALIVFHVVFLGRMQVERNRLESENRAVQKQLDLVLAEDRRWKGAEDRINLGERILAERIPFGQVLDAWWDVWARTHEPVKSYDTWMDAIQLTDETPEGSQPSRGPRQKHRVLKFFLNCSYFGPERDDRQMVAEVRMADLMERLGRHDLIRKHFYIQAPKWERNSDLLQDLKVYALKYQMGLISWKPADSAVAAPAARPAQPAAGR